MFFLLLKLIFFVLIIVFFAWQFLRVVLKQNEIFLLLPFSFGLGIIFYTFFVNVISYFIDVRISFWLVLFIMLVLAIFLRFKKRSYLILGIDKKTFLNIAVFSFLFGSVFALIILNNYAYDEEWHVGIIATISNGNFPVMSTYIPDIFMRYHYAFDLFAASLKSILSISVVLSSDLAMILIFLQIFWSIFVVVKKITNNTLAAWLSSWLLFFASGFRYLTALEQIEWSKGKYLWDYVGQFLTAFFSVKPMSPGLFHSFSVDSLGVLMYHRPTLFATLVMIFVFWLIYLEHKRGKFLYQIILALLLAFLALSAETWFVLVAFSWGLWKTLILFNSKNKKSLVYTIVSVTLITSFVVIFQGGVISDILLHGDEGTTDESMGTFVVRKVPGLISYGIIYPFTEFKSWVVLFLEWGVVLMLFPFVIRHAIKKKDVLLYYFLTIVFVALSIGFWLDYPVASRDLVRVNHLAFFIMSILAGMYLPYLLKERKKILAFVIIIISISPLMYNLRIIPAKLQAKNIQISYPDRENEYLVSKEIKKYLIEEGAVLTATPYMIIPYWERQVYWGNPEVDVVFNREVDNNFKKLIEEKDLNYIRSRGVKYIYVNKKFKELVGNYFIENNKDSLEEVYNKDNEYVVYKIDK
ncbi:hypothetical protein C0583_03780 [Candidatus Parcubacteria bacterium]|nr:MAG: hypothetical protein C0583_03780 [Candidatus Parcubacteria bacterium]